MPDRFKNRDEQKKAVSFLVMDELQSIPVIKLTASLSASTAF
jgi:hypothetical protein